METSVLILSTERWSDGVTIRKQGEMWDSMDSGVSGQIIHKKMMAKDL